MNISRLQELKTRMLERHSKAIILTCGPSLTTIPPDKIKKLQEKDYCILTVKSARLYYPNSDVHFYNTNNINLASIPKKGSKTTTIFECLPQEEEIFKGLHKDFTFFHEPNTDITKSLSYSHNFTKYQILNICDNRPWGPGIMYEMVLYFCLWAAFPEIYTIGWDLGPQNETVRKHFYDNVNLNLMNKARPMSVEESTNEQRLASEMCRWLEKKYYRKVRKLTDSPYLPIPKANIDEL